MNRHDVEALVGRFSKLKILVIGDFMLDQYIWGRVDRISPEAPVPIVNVESETFALGGAGNVVHNLQAMGAHVLPVGVIGQDEPGEQVLRMLSGKGIRLDLLARTNRPTTVKTRIVAHQQQVVRVDREERSLIEKETEALLAATFLEALDGVDGVVISDYSKGTIGPGLLAKILPAAKAGGKPVCLDPKPRYFSSYTPVTILTPNQTEAGSILGYPIVTEQDLENAGRRIFEIIDCKALLITRGEKGMALFSGGTMTLIPARAREVYDVTGAGDTVISILCLALSAGAAMLDAIRLTNVAAGIVVGKLGTATVSPLELRNEMYLEVLV